MYTMVSFEELVAKMRFIYVCVSLIGKVTLTPRLLHTFSLLVDVSCHVSITPVDSVMQTLFY